MGTSPNTMSQTIVFVAVICVLLVGSVDSEPLLGRGQRRDGMLVAQQAPIDVGSPSLARAQLLCPSACSGHGVCSSSDDPSFPAFCVCLYMWSGEDCSIASCPNNCSYSGVCNTTNGVCECNAGLGGADCSVRARRLMTEECPSNCSFNGVCVDARCQCFENYHGVSCEYEKCVGRCSGHGACWEPWSNTFECACNAGWLAMDCSIPALPCPDNCSEHGVCDHKTGICSCEAGWKADNCGTRDCVSGYLNRQGERYPPPYGGCPSDCQCRGYCVCNDNGDGTDAPAQCYCACEPGWAGVDCSISVSQEVPAVLQEPMP